MAPKNTRKTTPTDAKSEGGLVPVKFEQVDADDVEVRRRNRSSRFTALKDALAGAKVGASFAIPVEGDTEEEQAQFRTTLYAYMSRFKLLVSCKMTTDGRVLVTKKDPSTKRIVTRKKKAS